MPVKKISAEELARLKSKGGVTVKRRPGTAPKTPEPEATKKDATPLSGDAAPRSEPPAPAPAPIIDMQPMASMAATMAARDAQFERLIENNTRMLAEFRRDLEKSSVPKARKPWRATPKRGKDKLIEYVDIIPMELKT